MSNKQLANLLRFCCKTTLIRQMSEGKRQYITDFQTCVLGTDIIILTLKWLAYLCVWKAG